jgi:hypothetical protein
MLLTLTGDNLLHVIVVKGNGEEYKYPDHKEDWDYNNNVDMRVGS